MSLFLFFASDVELKERSNPYVEIISINEALKRNLDISLQVYEDFDKDEPFLLICDSEEHLYDINIFHDMYHSPIYSQEYSKKRYFSELQMHYSKKRAEQLIEYIKEQLNTTDEIELWKIWIDDHEAATTRTIYSNDLIVSDLDFLDMSKGIAPPYGLIIKRTT